MTIKLKPENLKKINYQLVNGKDVNLTFNEGFLTDIVFEPCCSDKCSDEKYCKCDEKGEPNPEGVNVYPLNGQLDKQLAKAKDMIQRDYAAELKAKKMSLENMFEKLSMRVDNIKTIQTNNALELNKLFRIVKDLASVVNSNKDDNEATTETKKEVSECQID